MRGRGILLLMFLVSLTLSSAGILGRVATTSLFFLLVTSTFIYLKWSSITEFLDELESGAWRIFAKVLVILSVMTVTSFLFQFWFGILGMVTQILFALTLIGAGILQSVLIFSSYSNERYGEFPDVFLLLLWFLFSGITLVLLEIGIIGYVVIDDLPEIVSLSSRLSLYVIGFWILLPIILVVLGVSVAASFIVAFIYFIVIFLLVMTFSSYARGDVDTDTAYGIAYLAGIIIFIKFLYDTRSFIFGTIFSSISEINSTYRVLYGSYSDKFVSVDAIFTITFWGYSTEEFIGFALIFLPFLAAVMGFVQGKGGASLHDIRQGLQDLYQSTRKVFGRDSNVHSHQYIFSLLVVLNMLSRLIFGIAQSMNIALPRFLLNIELPVIDYSNPFPVVFVSLFLLVLALVRSLLAILDIVVRYRAVNHELLKYMGEFDDFDSLKSRAIKVVRPYFLISFLLYFMLMLWVSIGPNADYAPGLIGIEAFFFFVGLLYSKFSKTKYD